VGLLYLGGLVVTRVVSRPGTAEAKDHVVAGIAKGKTLAVLAAEVGRTLKTLEGWRTKDPVFATRSDEARAMYRRQKEATLADAVAAQEEKKNAEEWGKGPRDISFEEFRRVYLDRDTYDHQRSWMYALDGKELPEGLPGTLLLRNPKRMIINVPPGHSKSTVITVEWAVYKICMNPNSHGVIIGKTEAKAKKFLHAVKQRLTDRRWSKLQRAYAPPGGFKQQGNVWTATQIYVGQPVASEEKDPTVQALGLKGDLQGARLQWMILDDVVDMQNAHLWEDQKEWLDDIAQSRLYGGQLLAVGTRAGNYDLYAALLDGDNFISGKSSWSHMKQPAVIEYGESPEDWVTLWPRSTQPFDPDDETSVPDEDGMYPTWDGPKLAEKRNSIDPAKWSLLYQQEETNATNTFKREAVWGSVNRLRKPGPLRAGAPGHPRQGREGMYVVASMDPNFGQGIGFVVVMAVDRTTQKRWVLNAFVKSHPSAEWTIETIKDVTEVYGVNGWVIENNGFQGFLVNLPEIKTFLATRGVRMQGHWSSTNKADPDFGISSMSGLFGSIALSAGAVDKAVHNGDNLIQIPDPAGCEGLKVLIEQLLIWEPGKSGKELPQDGPMALWFAEIRAREILGHQSEQSARTHAKQSKFATRRRIARRSVVPTHVYEVGG
jgi:hypothetical protein